MRADGHARDKWGRTLNHTGFQIVPNLLLTQQGNLGLSTTDIVVLRMSTAIGGHAIRIHTRARHGSPSKWASTPDPSSGA